MKNETPIQTSVLRFHQDPSDLRTQIRMHAHARVVLESEFKMRTNYCVLADGSRSHRRHRGSYLNHI